MIRRSFLTTILGGATAVTVGPAFLVESAKAGSLSDNPLTHLDETDAEFTQHRGRRGRPRRQVCSIVRDRFGRRRRVCRWV